MRGACLCGAVAFEVDPPLRQVVVCHCTQCRKQSGHVFAATAVPLDRFRLTRDDGLRWYRASDSARRGFCGHCGATMFWQPDAEARISFSPALLEGPTGLHIENHWHVEDAGDYYRPEGPPSALTSAPRILHGRCLCGDNRFSLPGPMGAVTACHCTRCRKQSGHHAARFDARESDLIWDRRTLTEYVTPDGGRRGFCPGCGSSLVFRTADGRFAVEAGCIGNPTGGRLSEHVFTAFKGDYYALTDGLPAHPGAGD